MRVNTKKLSALTEDLQLYVNVPIQRRTCSQPLVAVLAPVIFPLFCPTFRARPARSGPELVHDFHVEN